MLLESLTIPLRKNCVQTEIEHVLCPTSNQNYQHFLKNDIDHFRITAIWPGDRIRRPEHPTENEVRRRSCDESV